MEQMKVAKVMCMQCCSTIRDFGEEGYISHGLCSRCAWDFARQIDGSPPPPRPRR